MPKIYVEFKTWTEGGFDVSWPFVQFEETTDWRKRTELHRPADQSKIKGTFLSFDTETYDRFFEEYINAVIVGIVLEAEGSSDAIKKIADIFGYCEILGLTSADDERVIRIMEGAK